jgi:hypothetical protein
MVERKHLLTVRGSRANFTSYQCPPTSNEWISDLEQNCLSGRTQAHVQAGRAAQSGESLLLAMLCYGVTQHHVFVGFPWSLSESTRYVIHPSLAAVLVRPPREFLGNAAPICCTT